MRRYLPFLAAATVVACSSSHTTPLVTAPSAADSSSSVNSVSRMSVISPTDPTATLCVGGMMYVTQQDDEFQTDTALASSPLASEYIVQPLAPSIVWSTQLQNIGRFNNPGIDASYDVDPTAGLFGGYNPFSFSNGALNITAEPVPAQYAKTSALAYPTANPQPSPHSWLSGILQSPPLTYGYVEVEAEEPTSDGAWPAPLWLINSSGNTLAAPNVQEMDVNEVFGTVMPYGQVQQTVIYHYNSQPLPQSSYVRTSVSEDPSKNFHTYGLLWTPTSATMYIDRQPTGPSTPVKSTGPMNANIALQIYAPGIYGQNPGTAPISEKLKYYRWYQSAGIPCGPSVVPTPAGSAPATTAPSTQTAAPATAAPATAAPATAAPATAAPTTAAAAPTIVQVGNDDVSDSWGNVPGTLSNLPETGNMLVGVAAVNNPLTLPPGWIFLERDRANLQLFFCIVGSSRGNCPSATTYNFGGDTGNGGIVKLLEISGAKSRPIVGPDPGGWSGTFSRSLKIPAANGLTLAVDGLYTASAGIDSIAVTLPETFSVTTLDSDLNRAVGGNDLSLAVMELNQDAFAAPAPFSIGQTVGYSGSGTTSFGSNIVWIP